MLKSSGTMSQSAKQDWAQSTFSGKAQQESWNFLLCKRKAALRWLRRPFLIDIEQAELKIRPPAVARPISNSDVRDIYLDLRQVSHDAQSVTLSTRLGIEFRSGRHITGVAVPIGSLVLPPQSGKETVPIVPLTRLRGSSSLRRSIALTLTRTSLKFSIL